MLKVGGYLNILIAVGHIIGLFWADKMFEVTGISDDMSDLAQIHSLLPYLLTIIVALAFLVFGLYGLSADNKFMKLPFLKVGVFGIAGIYLFRGCGGLLFDFLHGTNTLLEVMYSLIAIFIGLLFLLGGLRKWKFVSFKKERRTL